MQALRACGFQLIPQVVADDDADWSVASLNLLVSPDERVRRHGAALRFAKAGQEAARGGA
ncbi:MAG: hypothetical protein ACM3OO_02395 [Planctomycetaceae bacterium]